MGDFTETEMLEYAQQLYTHPKARPMVSMPLSSNTHGLFSLKDVQDGLKKMVNGKAADTLHLTAELIKWTNEHTQRHIAMALNQALVHGSPTEWQENWIKPIYKGGVQSINKL